MRNLLSLVFSVCVVACVAPGTPDETSQAGETSAELSADPAAVAKPDFSLSFLNSCTGNSIVTNGGNAVIQANSDSCTRRDGSQTGPVGWSGFCTGDLANCNGNIACGC